ncbi:hypothetical protein BpHYR1_052099 [Brachionus plicatilis]|uniref:Uncharacterized protein n=1 Tax=Brachionus plicatilis TaxID=10195 RepID=A0A3M7RQ12_BRAPC|nr:hypothetical protein BpHYR1_052099 [Brachionus plicatilis]
MKNFLLILICVSALIEIANGLKCSVCEVCPGSSVESEFIEKELTADECTYCRTSYLIKEDNPSIIISKACVDQCEPSFSGGIIEKCCSNFKIPYYDKISCFAECLVFCIFALYYGMILKYLEKIKDSSIILSNLLFRDMKN